MILKRSQCLLSLLMLAQLKSANTMLFLKSILFICFLSITFSIQAESGSSKLKLTKIESQWLKDNPIIKVGGGLDWAPFDFLGEDKKYKGIAYDYLNLISEKTGLKFEVSIDQWSNNLKKIKQGEIDLLPAVYYSKERNKLLIFSDPYFSALDYFFVRDDLAVESLQDLNGKRVAIPKDFAHANFLKEYFPKIIIISVNTFGEAVDAVIENKADMLYDTYAAIIYALKSQGINSIVPFKSTRNIGDFPLHMVTRKDNPVLASIIQKGLLAITKDEKLTIYDRWLNMVEKSFYIPLPLAEDEKIWLEEHHQILFSGDISGLPYEAFDDEGMYVGIAAEYLKLIELKLGIEFEISQTKAPGGSTEEVLKGGADVFINSNNNPPTSKVVFSDSFLSSPVVIVMLDDVDYVENIQQIAKKNIAMVRHSSNSYQILNKYNFLDFSEVETVQQGLADVSTGKIDALLVSLSQASYQISQDGINNVRIVGKTEFKTTLNFGIKQEYSPLLPLINRAIADIDQADKQKILNAWGKIQINELENYRWLIEIVIVLIILLTLIFYWNRKLSKEIELRKKAESQVNTVINSIPLQVIVTDLNGKILSANPKAIIDYEIKAENIRDYNVLNFYADKKDREQIIKTLTDSGRVDQKIIPFLQPDGSKKSMMLSILPISYLNVSALLAIAVDMTERIEFEAALKKAKNEAESANKAKSEFLANMSHEIRTPMNAIIGFAEILNEQVQDSKHKGFVDTIQSAGKNLLTIINDILDLSKIEAGKLNIQKVACNPYILFTKLVDIFVLKISDKNIDFVLEISPKIPESLLLDEVRLRQVLFNLVGNALKFTNQGKIKLKAYVENLNKAEDMLDLVIEVEDTGVGISKQQQKSVFNVFEQSKGQNIKKYGGTGLGLSISQRLMEMMGGEISLKSQLEKGSTFTIRLNKVAIALETKPVEKIIQEKNDIVFKPCKILIVDDITNNRDLISTNFLETNVTTTEAENGLQAVEMVKKYDFDLVLMDIRMPVMDGYKAAKFIKAFSQVPIVALTASVMTEDFKQVKSNNFQGYLRKPILKKRLFEELSRFLPFTQNKRNIQKDHVIQLSKVEQKVLPELLINLKILLPQCTAIARNNNIAEIEDFSYAISGLLEKHPFSIVNKYVMDLNNNIESFNIMGIKNGLQEFPELVLKLEKLNSE